MRRRVTRADGTTYRLTSLNTHVNAWFVLDIDTADGRRTSYHLENAERSCGRCRWPMTGVNPRSGWRMIPAT
jgi:hypothetical protein